MPAITRFFDLLRQHRFLPVVLMVLGALTPLSMAPFSAWPVALLTLGLTGELLRGHSARRTAVLAWCHGFGLWALLRAMRTLV